MDRWGFVRRLILAKNNEKFKSFKIQKLGALGFNSTNLTKLVFINLNAKNGVGMTLFRNNCNSGKLDVVNFLRSRFARSSENSNDSKSRFYLAGKTNGFFDGFRHGDTSSWEKTCCLVFFWGHDAVKKKRVERSLTPQVNGLPRLFSSKPREDFGQQHHLSHPIIQDGACSPEYSRRLLHGLQVWLLMLLLPRNFARENKPD